ncbi:MAG: 3-deoxy-8-phosphooctulonate synthase [Pelagibacteraceae bacterium]|jgi:2-dehydro-3-deoxyphosphooctonate aldolase (KDO 8-P synthase)|nr:3-deoxy-8-phosphooctulonate synthase [Pelagibacteraceae bacterium]|tara:strand:+ start:147 stop:968 length:822 start_codon:yes stop_codon:yes gene_type:complete
MKNFTVKIGKNNVGNHLPLTLISGPCVVESFQHALDVAGKINEICSLLGINFIYKSSFDKANRTSIKSARGLGLNKSLSIFSEIKKKIKCSLTTDVHEPNQCNKVSKVVDLLQIPAFLCRQTDLLVAASKTKKPVNVKKGQFLSPSEITNVINKIKNNNNILLTERGYSFGYNNLISDMRSLSIMKKTGLPVIFDATHSVQQPGGLLKSSGGQREFVSVLSKAAVSVGIAGVLIETHNNPDKAPSDGPCMVPLKDLQILLEKLIELDFVTKNN